MGRRWPSRWRDERATISRSKGKFPRFQTRKRDWILDFSPPPNVASDGNSPRPRTTGTRVASTRPTEPRRLRAPHRMDLFTEPSPPPQPSPYLLSKSPSPLHREREPLHQTRGRTFPLGKKADQILLESLRDKDKEYPWNPSPAGCSFLKHPSTMYIYYIYIYYI